MKITIDNKLTLTRMSDDFSTEVCQKLVFTNPRWLENKKMGRWQGKTPRLLRLYEQTRDGALITPRGFARQLITLCRRHGVRFELDDHRQYLTEVDFKFIGSLKRFQAEAVDVMLQRDFGTISSPTGSGKTVMGLKMVAQRRQPALIVVHTKELLHQWIDRIESFLGIPAAEIGIIGGGKKRIGDRVTVGLVQTLYRCANEVREHFGHLVVDECHRTPSRTFTEAVSAFDCRYMLGLSATPWRRDKLSRLIFWHLGDIHHTIEAADLQESGDILKAEIIRRETNFRPYSDPSSEYSKMLSELTADIERNRLIASDVAREAGNGGGVCLVLSDRKAHCEALRAVLEKKFNTAVDTLTGDLSAGDRAAVVDRLNAGKTNVLVATGQLIGEGFDCKQLSTLFLATPIKFSGRVLQYLGRVLRPAPGKSQATVYDYEDVHVGPLVAATKARQRVYSNQR